MPTSRARTATLVLALLLLAIVLGTLTAGYATPVIGFAAKPPAAVTTTLVSVTPPVGLLLVKAQLNESSLSSPSLTELVAIQGANISLLDPSSAWRTVPPTNSSGEQTLRLAPDNYTVKVSDSFFTASTGVSVRANSTAEVNVTVQYSEYPSNLSIATDPDSSGYLSPSEPTTLVVSDSVETAIADNSTMFLALHYGTSGQTVSETAPPLSTQVPITVLSVIGRNASGLDAAWVQVEPKSSVPVAGLSSLSLVAYKPTVQVLTQ